MNAAEAFYLIRNNAHKDLIVGEDGTINMKDLHNNFVVNDENVEELKNKILNFQPADRDKNAKPKVMQIPGYVKEVQQIKDGATRWVFEDWHAKECGIKTLCWDRFGRAMLDPDEVKEDPINKSGKGSRGSNELTDLSKKMSRVLEMEEERRVDIMLSADEQNINRSEENEIQKPKKISSLKPAELKDEIKSLEEEFVAPDFFATLDDTFESGLQKDLENEILNSGTEDEAEVIEDCFDDKQEISVKSFFEYHNRERFLTHTALQNNFIDSVLRSVFSEQGAKDIFVQFVEKQIFIEKNYFARCVRDLMFENERRQFEFDFLTSGARDIFDGNKVNDILTAMSQEKKLFLSYGKGSGKMIFNMLLSGEDLDGDYYSGWYVKMNLGAHDAIMEFLNTHGINVEIVASEKAEIARRVKILGNVKKSY